MSFDDGNVLENSPFLPRPSLDKRSSLEEANDLVVGTSCMQGWRKFMEDVSTVWLHIPGDRTDTKYFGVFDGHGGPIVAEYAGTFLLQNIMNQKEWETDLEEAIRKGYVDCDQKLREEKDPRSLIAGCTALTVFIRGNQLYCGNVGDSRAIASESHQVVRLSNDHKPTLPSERERIVSGGGFVTYDRVNGNLSLSRALGDFAYKKESTPPSLQVVSPVPEIVKKTLNSNWEFVVMACDGIWEVLTDESVRRFVASKLIQNNNPDTVAESLINRCLSPTCNPFAAGCDNMTVIILQMKVDKINTGIIE